jgi:hypothetical protein
MTDDRIDSEECKTAFAIELLKNPADAFKAALQVFPDDTGLALRAAHTWPKDPFVLAEQVRITEDEGEAAFLPSKAELCRDIWARMKKDYISSEDYVKLAKLYAEVRSFIEKPNTNVNVAVVTNKVMVVKDLGSNDEWEMKAERQQRELLNVSTSRH